ncbi:hypothetical protein Z043_122870, partial [Scleropages formosus]
MAGLPPGDPQLVSMIVSHLKTQGLFDQFRRDCLADVDTKPAYLNLRQRVDNFVSNHLSNHTWSPHLNKNQLRNNIRQLVLQSGMLEQGVDRIVAQVVDPKIHHTFRPQVEKVVREFLSPGQVADEALVCPAQTEEKQDQNILTPGDVLWIDLMVFPGPSIALATSVASDAMSILDTITSLNQGANSWITGDKPGDKSSRRPGVQWTANGGLERDQAPEELLQEEESGEQDMSLVEEEEESAGQVQEEKPGLAVQEMECETDKASQQTEEGGIVGEVEQKGEEHVDGEEPKEPEGETMELKAVEGKDKASDKVAKKVKEEASARDGETPSEKHRIRQKARERLKE